MKPVRYRCELPRANHAGMPCPYIVNNAAPTRTPSQGTVTETSSEGGLALPSWSTARMV